MLKVNSISISLYYILYRIILDIIYIFWQNPIYNYMSFTLDFNFPKIIFSYLILLLLIFIIPKNEKKASYLILQLHLIIMIIPMTSIYGLANFSSEFMLMITLVFSMQILLVKYLPNITFVKIKGIKTIVFLVTIFLTFSVYGYLLITQKIHFNVFNFKGIYEIRNKHNIYFLMSYLITWQYRIINPILLVLFYLKRKKKAMILIAFIQFLIFAMYPHKEVFFAVGYLIILLFLYRKKFLFSKFFIALLIFGSILTSILSKLSTILMPYAILPSRLLYTPALIKFQHYNFFTQNVKLNYSEGLIGRLLGATYPYTVPSGYVVSLQNGFNSNANTGYLAYAYDNAGFIGMVMMSLFFVIVLKIIDSQTKKYNPKLIFTFVSYPMLILNDGDLLTLLLTGGLFLIILLLFSIDEFVGDIDE